MQKEHQKTIENLEEIVKWLRLKCSDKSVYFCGECDYLADCVHDFNDHTHSLDDQENEDNSLLTCRFCDEIFGTLAKVMKHNKLIHTSNVQHCQNYLENICLFGDSCWFLHSETLKDSEPSFECSFCDQKFKTKNTHREHMKTFHVQYVTICIYILLILTILFNVSCPGMKKVASIQAMLADILYENCGLFLEQITSQIWYFMIW